MSYSNVHPMGRGVLAAALVAACASAVGAGNAMASYTVTPPSSVPTTFTDSNAVTPSVGLEQGLSAQLWTISPTTNLGNYNPAGLDGGAGTGGIPNLQGMANEEMLAQNGTITIGSAPSAGSGTYYATPLFSFVDTAINTYGHIYAGVGGNVNFFLGGGDPGFTNLLTGVTVPTSVANTAWNNILFDQSGYVYVPQANSSYTFSLQNNDDGTEVLLGGNGKTGSGTVVNFENANGPSSSDTITFSKAGYYPIEIFNSQTWGGANLQVSFAPVDTNTPNLVFYTATPEPAPWLLLGTGIASVALLRRRLVR